MSKTYPFVALLLALMLVLIGASAALAQAPSNGHDKVIETDVTWTILAGQCPAVPYELTGTGHRHQVINTKVNVDGSQTVITNDVVKGTARDATGTYRFSYENHRVDQIPASGSPVQISMADTFILNGNGAAGKLNVGFNWRWSYYPPGEEYWPPVHDLMQITTRGDPYNCDPI